MSSSLFETAPTRPKPIAPPAPARPSSTPLIVLGILAVIAVAFIAARRKHQALALAEATDEMAIPAVAVMLPSTAQAAITLTLPGDVEPFYSAPIYARTPGYLKRRFVDIGAEVKTGQLLAEIDAPEVDQQLDQARAQSAQAKANYALAAIVAKRWQELISRNVVSQEEVDEKNGALAEATAALAASQAEVRRLEQLQSFEKITAPFDGVITDRKTEIGDLINAGSSTTGSPLFQIAQVRTLRVYVQVPEAYSSEMVIGTRATLDLDSAPGLTLSGKVVDTARAIDPASRTLLTEVQVVNADERLLAGSYAQVHFHIKLNRPPLVLPVNALLFRPEGVQVGVVGADGVVAMKTVRIGRNFGTTVEIEDGLEKTDRVILNPSDSLTSGTKVDVVRPGGA